MYKRKPLAAGAESLEYGATIKDKGQRNGAREAVWRGALGARAINTPGRGLLSLYIPDS